MLYLKSMTLREIGDELGVSESRVCQLHGQIKARLSNELSGDHDLLVATAWPDVLLQVLGVQAV